MFLKSSCYIFLLFFFLTYQKLSMLKLPVRLFETIIIKTNNKLFEEKIDVAELNYAKSNILT